MTTLTPTHLVSLNLEAAEPASLVIPRRTALAVPNRRVDRWIKRGIDVVASGLGLIALAPIMALIAVLIRLDSRGPILFRQVRLGLNGGEFHCLKFRTMVPDAEARLKELETLNESQGGVLFKIKSDPRVTPLGRFLRKSSLDELPQLFNVFWGEMSLVGPRPLQLRDCRNLIAIDPDGFEERLRVLPGITGPWQVGGRSDVSSEHMLDLDLDYVANHCLATDLRILAQTVLVVLKGRGAC